MTKQKSYKLIKIQNKNKESFDLRIGSTSKIWINLIESELVDLISQLDVKLNEISKKSKIYNERIIDPSRLFDKILSLASLKRAPRVASERLNKSMKKLSIIGHLVQLEKFELVKEYMTLEIDEIKERVDKLPKNQKVYKELIKIL